MITNLRTDQCSPQTVLTGFPEDAAGDDVGRNGTAGWRESAVKTMVDEPGAP
ncbi:hypothetical protein ACIQU6_15580 [Streptomyces sp. NPDC090442]|uniref:hypothetical protein n=1 Tax=Streptomyces sp. NPDC090442 TaxID=3365962 RepID=UPI003821EDFC